MIPARPARPARHRRVLPATGLCALALAVSGCSSDEVPVPRPEGRAAQACRALADELPGTVDGRGRAEAEPESPYTAAWGDPRIVLRCGVARPEVLTPGTEGYNPTSDAAEVNGVSWLVEQREGGYRFTTTDRVAFVEVDVPAAYAPEIGVLTDFAEAVRGTVPAD